MKASEVIERIEEIVAEHGDVPVYCWNFWGEIEEIDDIEYRLSQLEELGSGDKPARIVVT